jgi:hypothetical protein
MICQEDHDQILDDPNATTDELRSIIAELRLYYLRHRRDIDADNRRAERHNNETRVTAINARQPWTTADDNQVRTSPLTALELSKVIGRSMRAIHKRKVVLHKMGLV